MGEATDRNANVEVLVVGAGPVGLTMAAELARHGVRSRIIDKLASPSPFCRAIGVTPRTLEVWDDMGIAREMIDAGLWITGMRMITAAKAFDSMTDLSDLPYSSLGLPQYETERLLAKHVETFGIKIERGISLESLAQSNERVRVTLVNSIGDREAADFRYVIGCDGAHSAVRRALDIEFEGEAMPYGFMLGDVKIDWDLPRGMACFAIHPVEKSAPDLFIAVPLPEEKRYRVSMLAPQDLAGAMEGGEHGIQSERPAPGIAHLQAVADRLLPGKPKLEDMRWSSIFRISMRLAKNYRVGNVFIAGDAAHIHPPTGGQGMNTGIQDAYNLAWKLSLVMKSDSPASLLDSYEIERRAVGEDVIARTVAATMKLDRRGSAEDRLADTQVLVNYRKSSAVAVPIADANAMTGPIAGDRVPDCGNLARVGIGFPLRLFDLLRGTPHVLIAYLPGKSPDAEIADYLAAVGKLNLGTLVRVIAITESSATATERFGVAIYRDSAGEFAKIFGSNRSMMLVRPDGYLAWRGDILSDGGLTGVLENTFSAARKK